MFLSIKLTLFAPHCNRTLSIMKKTLAAAALLLTLAPLSACTDNARPEWLGGEPKRPAADVHPGNRRVPALNNQALERVPPPPDHPVPPPPPHDFYGNGNMAPPPPMPAPDNRVMDDESVRKPFGVDPAYSTETQAVAPLPPSPELTVSPETQAAMAPHPAAAEEKPAGNVFSRMAQRLGDQPEAPEVEKVKDKPYPKLSDVPERPAEFADVKANHMDTMADLQSEHAMAQESREMVNEEPTQTGSDEVLLGHAHDAKADPAQVMPKTQEVVSTMESPPGEIPVKRAEAPKPPAKPVAKKTPAKKSVAKKPVAKKSTSKKTKTAAKKTPTKTAVKTKKPAEPAVTDAPATSVPEQGLY
jgi:hypothetical protein